MPAGDDVTVPEPDFVTVSRNDFNVNVAVTVFAPSIVTWHVPVPLQPPPLQPVKFELVAGAAVSVTI